MLVSINRIYLNTVYAILDFNIFIVRRVNACPMFGDYYAHPDEQQFAKSGC